MSETVLSLDSDFLIFLLEGGKAFTNPPDLLGDLKAEDAVKNIDNSPHSIATIVSHLDYWQTWFLKGVDGELEPYPDSFGSTFFPVESDQWQDLRSNLLNNQAKIRGICNNAKLLERPFSLGKSLGGGHDERSVGMTLLYTVVMHNAHHYGQIITLRQMMSLWPPAAGGIS